MKLLARLPLLLSSVALGAVMTGCGPDPQSSGVPGTGADAGHDSAGHTAAAGGESHGGTGEGAHTGEQAGAHEDAGTATSPKTAMATIQTSMGTIEVALDGAKAPVSVKNFIAYAKKGHYNGTIFHRVIPDFMIQGGGFSFNMTEKPTGAGIKNEASNGLKNQRGTLAMARTSDPDSATSQFFINTADNTTNLGPGGVDQFGYAVFGKVVKGMDVVDKIRVVKTTTKGPHENVPEKPVVIQKITVK